MMSLINKLCLLMAAAVLLVWALPLARSGVVAFAAGELLFGLNLIGLIVASRWLLGMVSAAPGAARGANPSLFLAMGVKVLLLGGGAYLALVTFNLRADFFVAGLGCALGLLSWLLYLDGAKKRVATGAGI